MMKLFPVIAALALLAFGPAPAQAADAGESDFKARCSTCHKTPAMVVGFMKKHGDAKERTAWLEKKLSGHHAPDAKQRARIIAYLEKHLAQAK